MESHKRSLVKAISYRLGGAVVTGAVAWIATRQVDTSLTVAGLDGLAKFFLYYIHERAWNYIPFGRPKSPDYEI